MKRGFTLLELLVIVGVMGLMVTVGIVSVRSGRGTARVKGATRDVFAAIRRARSTALVTQQPAVITYSTGELDGEPIAKIEISSAKLVTAGVDRSKIRTLRGDPLKSAGDDAGDGESEKGDTLEEILFAPVAEDIVKGMRIKVLSGDEIPDAQVETEKKSAVSVFSNVDYLLGRFKEAKKKEEAESAKTESADSAKDAKAAAAESQEPVSFVWETNGRIEPHQVWVYADGRRPEDGLLIKIDRFGAAKVLPGDGREDGE